jgi:DtxR family manganese transport transcriptional regulator
VNPHRKTRDDHADELAEDYVEAILRLDSPEVSALCDAPHQVTTTALAKHFDVAQPTVTKHLNRLQEEGYVCIHPWQFIHLTESGIQLARESLQRHELVVTFLRRIGVSELQAELDAEGVEHHFSSETLSAIRAFVSKHPG